MTAFNLPRAHLALPDWQGETVAIVAPGPSAAGIDFGLLAGMKIVALNDAFMLTPEADVLLSGDHRFFRRGPNLDAYTGPLIVCTDPVMWDGRPLDPRMVYMRRAPRKFGLAESRFELAGSVTTLSLALNYVKHRGAKRVLLIGVDGGPGPAGERRAVGDATEGVGALARYDRQDRILMSQVGPLAAAGVEVINCNPKSRFTAFRKMPLEQAVAPPAEISVGEPALPIVLWQWGGRFPQHYIDRMKNMLHRHLNLRHEIVLISDRPAPREYAGRFIPLWDDYRVAGKCHVRLKAFHPSMREIIGPRFAWIDLDMIIVDDVTPMFSRTEDFVISGVEKRPQPYNGSMVLMDAGCRPQVFDTFDKERWLREKAEKRYGGSDQAWIAICLGENEATWTRDDGLFCYRDDIDAATGTHGKLPPGARMIQMNGRFKPERSFVHAKSPWVRQHWI